MLTDAAVSDTSAFAHSRNRVTRELLTGLDVTRLLDYGCGHAEFAIAAANELNLTVHACDVNPALIDDLRRRYGPEIDFFAISESEPVVSLDDEQVSAVTCCDVLEHMAPASRVTALREMHRVLAEDGVLVVTTPHKGLLSAADPENIKFHFPRVHRAAYTLAKGKAKYEQRYGGQRFGNFSAGAERHVHFSTAELAALLKEAGFHVEETRYFTLIYPFARSLLWVAESLPTRLKGVKRLRSLMWSLYVWDSDLEPGKLGCVIAMRAVKSNS